VLYRAQVCVRVCVCVCAWCVRVERVSVYVRRAACGLASTNSQQPTGRHCFTYIGSPNGPIQRPNPVRYVQYGCYEATARSETRKLARGPRATRALPRLKNMALKVAKMGT
jgi:hypothetical protein